MKPGDNFRRDLEFRFASVKEDRSRLILDLKISRDAYLRAKERAENQRRLLREFEREEVISHERMRAVSLALCSVDSEFGELEEEEFRFSEEIESRDDHP